MVLLSRNQFLRSHTHGQRKEKLWPEKEKTSEREKTDDGRHDTLKEGKQTGAFCTDMSMPVNIPMLK